MPEWLHQWWPALALSASILSPLLVGWIGWSVAQRFASKEDLARIDEARRAADEAEAGERRRLDARVGKLEEHVQHCPTEGDVRALSLDMAELRGELREVRAILSGTRDLLERIEARGDRHEAILTDAARRS